ncbi:hypothetical protein BKA63DRAFT_138025 [Paraphoma chrysanthemicola]|nr:hypothetical protein BKA63DRAFT_138025 [Paraphoma chrysanthemicola]
MSISQPESQAHFRFLDLPKEIRLMVYDRLPMRKKYHAFRPSVPTPDPCHEQPFAFMSTALTGLAILATCHQIHEEASAILRIRIAHRDQQPLRLITSSKFLQDYSLLGILRPIAAGESLIREDLISDCLYAHIDRQLRHQGQLDLIIAIRDIALHPPTAESIISLDFSVKMFCLGFYGLSGYMRDATTARLKICIRTVLPVPDEGKVVEPFACPDPFVGGLDTLEHVVRVAKNITANEWEQDWAEGERYF